ncbi:hypothetical protein AX15_001051 [Amanita polypyramis BW_CC]|nr:hypothetical protein AX15_001051 [Amanita polypyramis BW_CC]
MSTPAPDSEHFSGQNENPDNKIGRDGITPLPWSQLSILCLIQFAEPVTATVIYPFVNQFVRETGITAGDETKTGYYAGIIESLFFFAEATTVVFWGMASDRIGRRPILLLGPLGLSMAMLSFGASTSFWPLVYFRFLQGTFNGNIGVAKSVLAEIADKTNIADAFATIPVVWSIGATLGPVIGGLLARPATRWPELFGKLAYLRDHPYFLPCFAASLVAFSSFLGGLVRLKETIRSGISQQKAKRGLVRPDPTPSTHLLECNDIPRCYSEGETHNRHENTFIDVEDISGEAAKDNPKPPSFREIMTPRVLVVLTNQGFLTFCDMCIQVLLPLMWSTSVEHGGLGFTPYTIGLTMGAYGVINAFIQVNFLSKVLKYFGPRRVFITAFSTFFISLVCFLLEGYLARQTGGVDWRVWTTIVVHLMVDSMRYAAYGSIQMMITDSAPQSLGTMNGMAQAVGCAMRSLAPYAASSLFAVSLQRNWAGGNAVYFALMVVVACGVRSSLMLPKTLQILE